jgi:hypothetical protein
VIEFNKATFRWLFINRDVSLKRLFLITISLFSLSTVAGDGIQLPSNDKERLYHQNQALSAMALFNAYISDDVFQRRLAEAYALGALNATQGKVWCNTGILSPDAFREQIYTALKQHQDDAASNVLVDHFANFFPCREQHNETKLSSSEK